MRKLISSIVARAGEKRDPQVVEEFPRKIYPFKEVSLRVNTSDTRPSQPGADTQDRSTQVDETLLAIASLEGHGGPCPILSLPQELVLQLLESLDIVSTVCLKLTCRRLRQAIPSKKEELSRCAAWRITCRLERDLMAKGAPLPRFLACAFCKRKHPHKMFGLPNKNVGYGFENLQMLGTSRPETRYCWLHFPKRISYHPKFRNPQHEAWARSLPEDRWIATTQRTCMHCGDLLLEEDEVTGQAEKCPACIEKCAICGYGIMGHLSRFGPERTLEAFKYIRVIRRQKTDGALEIWDVNNLHRKLPKGVKYSRYSVIDFGDGF